LLTCCISLNQSSDAIRYSSMSHGAKGEVRRADNVSLLYCRPTCDLAITVMRLDTKHAMLAIAG